MLSQMEPYFPELVSNLPIIVPYLNLGSTTPSKYAVTWNKVKKDTKTIMAQNT